MHASGLHCAGRVVLNLWRVLRSELKLNVYTFENCVASILRRRAPHVPPAQLASWFNGGPAGGPSWSAKAILLLYIRCLLKGSGRPCPAQVDAPVRGWMCSYNSFDVTLEHVGPWGPEPWGCMAAFANNFCACMHNMCQVGGGGAFPTLCDARGWICR
jgi:hypothetical protein